MVKELKDEELDRVTGGIAGYDSKCKYYMHASGKPDINMCDNCFFWIKDGDENKCSSPLKNEKLTKAVL